MPVRPDLLESHIGPPGRTQRLQTVGELLCTGNPVILVHTAQTDNQPVIRNGILLLKIHKPFLQADFRHFPEEQNEMGVDGICHMKPMFSRRAGSQGVIFRLQPLVRHPVHQINDRVRRQVPLQQLADNCHPAVAAPKYDQFLHGSSPLSLSVLCLSGPAS
ncbi:hypothetical protein D3C75_720020 [compost metagenome]